MLEFVSVGVHTLSPIVSYLTPWQTLDAVTAFESLTWLICDNKTLSFCDFLYCYI